MNIELVIEALNNEGYETKSCNDNVSVYDCSINTATRIATGWVKITNENIEDYLDL